MQALRALWEPSRYTYALGGASAVGAGRKAPSGTGKGRAGDDGSGSAVVPEMAMDHNASGGSPPSGIGRGSIGQPSPTAGSWQRGNSGRGACGKHGREDLDLDLDPASAHASSPQQPAVKGLKQARISWQPCNSGGGAGGEPSVGEGTMDLDPPREDLDPDPDAGPPASCTDDAIPADINPAVASGQPLLTSLPTANPPPSSPTPIIDRPAPTSAMLPPLPSPPELKSHAPSPPPSHSHACVAGVGGGGAAAAAAAASSRKAAMMAKLMPKKGAGGKGAGGKIVSFPSQGQLSEDPSPPTAPLIPTSVLSSSPPSRAAIAAAPCMDEAHRAASENGMLHGPLLPDGSEAGSCPLRESKLAAPESALQSARNTLDPDSHRGDQTILSHTPSTTPCPTSAHTPTPTPGPSSTPTPTPAPALTAVTLCVDMAAIRAATRERVRRLKEATAASAVHDAGVAAPPSDGAAVEAGEKGEAGNGTGEAAAAGMIDHGKFRSASLMVSHGR